MALQKQPININFGQGLDTKTDPNQVQIGKFLQLQNSVFDTAGRLTKRNGFNKITTLPNEDQTTLTTLNDNLIATGSNLYAYSENTDQWLNQGTVQPISLNTLPLVRVSTSQTSPDMSISSDNLGCLVYVDNSVAYYQIQDNTTGQQIVKRTALPATAAAPRAFLLGRYFIITYLITVGGATHLQYIAIPTMNPLSPRSPADVATTVNSLTAGYDGVVTNNGLYLAWATAATSISLTYLSSTLVVQAAVSIASHTATLMSVTADTSASTSVIWVSFWDSSSTNGFSAAFSANLVPILASTQIITATVINEITSVATNSVLSVFYENNNTYGGAIGSVKTDFLTTKTVAQAGTVSAGTVILRSVGLASKAFIAYNSTIYMLVTYGETNQPTYFLIDSVGNIYMRLAYANGGGYEASQVLPSVSVLSDDSYATPYLIKDFLTTVNKNTDNPTGTPSNAIYTQTGINLATFAINDSNQYSSEIAGVLNLTGGQIWQYDGVKPVEQGFNVWPENAVVSNSGTGGSIGAGTYFYQFTYEWTDNAGNLHRSAPSIPISITTTGSTSTNTLTVPTLRLTYKTAPNPVRIVGYRWSVAQQVYYQFTSVTNPTVNNPSVDFVSITDTQSDAQILGNAIIYTTGGVVEDIAPPASIASALFKNRLFLIDAEDQNLIWYSKQVIENTPVEMSDLFTVYVAPTSGAQGSTGPLTALSAMDDKLIMFKKDAIYYLTGTGPDNTGANNDFIDPVYITASVGCANPDSIVLMPNGLMFQSDKGIWLLGRDLSTVYIGAPVELYNNIIVESATAIPGTNQVRFILNNGITLMYDYFYQQWGTFSNIHALSATLYQGKHTYLNSFGAIYQETPGSYLDGSTPVLMNFTTSWINLAGLQGYERFYFMYLLGTYYTPFKLNVQLSYDYNPNSTQNILITPDNYSAPWGGEALWGSGGDWGGNSNVFEARLFPQVQKCESFQIVINEIYDSSLGVAAGAGLTMSGLNMIVGAKRGFRTQRSSRSFG